MKKYIKYSDSELQVIRNDILPKAELKLIGIFDVYNMTPMKKMIQHTVGDMFRKGITGSVLIHEKHNGITNRIATIVVEFHDDEDK